MRWARVWLAATALVAGLVFALLPEEQRLPLLRSLAVGGIAALTALALGVSYAYAVSRWRVPGARLLAWAGVAPLVVPPYLAAIGWVDAFGPAGRIPRWLGLELPRGPSLLAEGLVYTTPSCGFLLGCSFFPLVFLAARAALERVPRSALEAARLVRGRGGEARVLWSSAAPQALAAALFVFALSAVEFAVPQLLRVRVLAEAVTLKMSAEYDPGGALLLGLPLIALSLLAVGAAFASWRAPSLPAGDRAQPEPLGAMGGAGVLALCLTALGPGLLLPALAVVSRLLSDPRGEGGGVRRAAGILSSAMNAGYEDARRSVGVGLVTATLGVVVTLALAWPLRRLGRRARLGAAWLLALTIACPAPLIAVGVILIFNRPGLAFEFYDSLGAVVLACLCRFAPLAAWVIWFSLARVPREQEEAARLAGRAPFLGVSLPQAAPGILAAWLILYVLSVTEFGATALVEPPGSSLLSVFLVNQAHYGQGAELSGLSTLLLAAVLLPLGPLAALGTWGRVRWGR